MNAMNDLILNTDTLPEPLFRLIGADKVRIQKEGKVITMMPVEEPFDCVAGLRGMLAGNRAISVDKFLERKHADKELDL
jgi:virulence-associated protein VagC